MKQRTKPRALDEIEAAFPSPPTLSAEARPEWVALLRTLSQLGTARVCDLRTVQLLAEVLANEVQLRELIAREGTTRRHGRRPKGAPGGPPAGIDPQSGAPALA